MRPLRLRGIFLLRILYGGARDASVNDKQIAILHSASSRSAKRHRGGQSNFKLAALPVPGGIQHFGTRATPVRVEL